MVSLSNNFHPRKIISASDNIVLHPLVTPKTNYPLYHPPIRLCPILSIYFRNSSTRRYLADSLLSRQQLWSPPLLRPTGIKIFHSVVTKANNSLRMPDSDLWLFWKYPTPEIRVPSLFFDCAYVWDLKNLEIGVLGYLEAGFSDILVWIVLYSYM